MNAIIFYKETLTLLHYLYCMYMFIMFYAFMQYQCNASDQTNMMIKMI